MVYLYRCDQTGPVNNGLKPSCDFSAEMEEGTHHCPICGSLLQFVTRGISVSELLRRGFEAEKTPSPKHP